MFRHHQNEYAALLDRVVAHRSTWLDVGAGTQLHDGWLGAAQSSVAERASLLIGADVVTEHLRRNPFIDSATGASLYALPFSTSSFEVVTANMVLEHLDQPAQAFDEIARVLAPGGRFLFVTPHKWNPIIRASSILLSQAARRRLAAVIELREEEHIFPTFYRANSSRAIERYAKDAGFNVEYLERFYSYPFLQNHPRSVLLEIALDGLLHAVSGNRFGTNLIGVLTKKA